MDILPVSPKPALRAPPARGWAIHGWLGLLLVATSWPLNWMLTGLRSHALFFPLWLGAILVLDALVLRRRGSSLLSRSPARFAALFMVSVPLWWLFELMNKHTRNWEYLGESSFTPLTYALYASWNFSIVVPAIFEAAELMLTTRWIGRLSGGPRIPDSRAVRRTLAVSGALMFALLMAWPRTLDRKSTRLNSSH